MLQEGKGGSLPTGDYADEIQKDGYTILPQVFEDDELEEMKKFTHNIIDFHESGSRDPYTLESCEYMDHRTDQGALYDLYQRHPEFRQMAEKDEVLDVAESVLGSNIHLYENSLVYKPESGDNEVPFHQDFMDRTGESDKLITWMPMFDVNRENGCIKAIPGSHLGGSRSWHREEGETHHTRLDEDQYDESSAVYLEMNAGDVLMFHQDLIHGSDEISGLTNPRFAYRTVYKSIERDGVFVPRSGPIMLRGGHPEAVKSDNLALSENDIGDERSFIQRVSHFIGSKLMNV